MKKFACNPGFRAFKIIQVKLLAVSFLWIPIVFAANKSQAQAMPARTLLALSKSDHTLSIIDPITLKVIATAPVGSDPHEVIASADGKTAYVSIYGGGSLHELSVVDLVGQKALPPIDTKPLMGPHGLTFAGGKVWFSAEGAKAVGRYDPATGKFDWAMGTGQDRTHMIYVTDDSKKVYTTNVSSATVSILVDSLFKPVGPRAGSTPPTGSGPLAGFAPPARKDWVQTVIPVAKGSEGFDVSPDGRELWTAGADDGNISIIDIVAKKVTATIDAKVAGAKLGTDAFFL
jgi:YVTN family beta-propeller protein